MIKQAPGKTLLQAVGILLIVLGVFAAFSAAMAFASFTSVDSSQELAATMKQEGVTKTMMLISGLVSGIASVTYMIAGILGVKYCNEIDKAKICMVLGIALVVEILAEAVYEAFFGQFNMGGVISGLLLPALYLLGAFKNKQAQMIN